MKGSRVIFVAGASAAMLAAGWKVGSLPVPSLVLADPAAGSVGTDPSATPNAVTTPSPTATSAAGGTTTTTTTTTTPAPKTTTTAPKTTTAPPAPKGPTGTYVGPSVATAYGNMQVQLVIKNGKITAVQPLVIGLGDGTSRRINASAVPTLQSRVLAKQTYKVSYVSGASYTSSGFLSSVKGAMQKAGLA